MVSRSETISLKMVKLSSKDVPSIIWWEYSLYFRCNLLVRRFVMHSYSNFKHNPTTIFSFRTSCRIWLDRWRWIWDKAFRSLRCFSSCVYDEGILSNPNSASSKSIYANITRILTCHGENLVLRSTNRISYFIVTIVKKIKPRSNQTLLWPVCYGKTRICNKKKKYTQIYMENPRQENHGKRRRIIHYVNNWYKMGEYQTTTIKILENLYIIAYMYGKK